MFLVKLKIFILLFWGGFVMVGSIIAVKRNVMVVIKFEIECVR